MPYGTTPTWPSLFKPASKRIYHITILEEAEEPERSALFRNLPYEAQVAVIAHELVHVLQYNACSIPGIIKLVLSYPLPAVKKKIERAADLGAIDHWQGNGLYRHAIYLRSIPGYLQKRPEIDK